MKNLHHTPDSLVGLISESSLNAFEAIGATGHRGDLVGLVIHSYQAPKGHRKRIKLTAQVLAHKNQSQNVPILLALTVLDGIPHLCRTKNK